MGNCCSGKVTITEQIRERMRGITHTFPTMTAAVLLQPDGETVVGLPADAVLPADLLAAITTFKKTANAFGAALSQQDCPVIHIRGKATLFSCYDIDRYLLAVYSDIPPGSDEHLETTSFDESIRPLLEDLRQHLVLFSQQGRTKKSGGGRSRPQRPPPQAPPQPQPIVSGSRARVR